MKKNLAVPFPARLAALASAIVELIKRERVDLSFDFHEAPPGSRLAMMIVANPKNIDLAAEAALSLQAKGLEMKIEESSPDFRGLSHREWGHATPAMAFLFETPNPAFLKDRPGDPVNDPAWPLAKRVGIHLEALRTIIEVYNGSVPETRRVEIVDLPDPAEFTRSGLGVLLR